MTFVEGERYRVTVEGVIDGDGCLTVVNGRGSTLWIGAWFLEKAVAVERVEPPRKDGELFKRGDGALFLKVPGGYRLVRHGDGEPAHDPAARFALDGDDRLGELTRVDI